MVTESNCRVALGMPDSAPGRPVDRYRAREGRARLRAGPPVQMRRVADVGLSRSAFANADPVDRYPPIWSETWVAIAAVVAAREWLFGSRLRVDKPSRIRWPGVGGRAGCAVRWLGYRGGGGPVVGVR